LIAELKQNQKSFSTDRLSSEISTFAQVTQSILKQLNDAQVLTANDRRALESSIQKLSSISGSEHPKTKITHFFDEPHNLCQFLAEIVVHAGASKEVDVPSATVLLHDSEM
jgi:hypothetical protein